jgi:thiol-disulfide isomerase/thioredoxin
MRNYLLLLTGVFLFTFIGCKQEKKAPLPTETENNLEANIVEKNVVPLEEISLEEVQQLMKNDSENIVLINLWATWCAPCVKEMPELVEVYKKYQEKGYEFITISIDKMNKKNRAQEILTDKQAVNKNFIFNGDDLYYFIGTIDDDWQGSLPFSVLLAPGGEKLYRVEGVVDIEKLEQLLSENL